MLFYRCFSAFNESHKTTTVSSKNGDIMERKLPTPRHICRNYFKILKQVSIIQTEHTMCEKI